MTQSGSCCTQEVKFDWFKLVKGLQQSGTRTVQMSGSETEPTAPTVIAPVFKTPLPEGPFKDEIVVEIILTCKNC